MRVLEAMMSNFCVERDAFLKNEGGLSLQSLANISWATPILRLWTILSSRFFIWADWMRQKYLYGANFWNILESHVTGTPGKIIHSICGWKWQIYWFLAVSVAWAGRVIYRLGWFTMVQVGHANTNVSSSISKGQCMLLSTVVSTTRTLWEDIEKIELPRWFIV